MFRKLLLAAALALGVTAATSGTASAQYVRHGNHYHYAGGGGYYGGGRVYSVPVYSPPRVIVSPGYGYGGGWGSPVYGGGWGYPSYGGWGGYPSYGYGGGYPYYGGSFGTVGVGYSRPGFGINLGFIIR